MLRGILQILPALITIESAIFLLMSNLFPSSISLLKNKTNHENIELVRKDIIKQSANTWVGVLLLLLSAILQIQNIFDYPKVFEMGNPPISSLYISILISILIFAGCMYLSKRIRNSILSKIT